MKIKSVATLRKDLNPKTQEALITRDFELPLGKVFNVYGISVWNNVLSYLIVEDAESESKPFWFPAELFVVEDTLLPAGFHHKYYGLRDKRGVNALWGYKEMVDDSQHYIALIEREAEAEEIFLKRKKEIDAEQKDEPN
jgi:hypothetical protein